ncbi:MAG TPA: hypothetical protein VHM31_06290 [Polyangia bacterium]|nr:hypothetical protein [Polyangia bacterium]
MRADDVLRYVTTGAISCPRCASRVDIRDRFGHFPVFGHAEGLFGLQTWRATHDIPPSTAADVMIWDVGPELPYTGRIVYANITNALHDEGSLTEAPSLMLWNQSPHHPWHTRFRFHVPAGGRRSISLLIVVKPDSPTLPFPLEIALQAVDAFHRGHLAVAVVMLAAAVEACLRPRIEVIYKARGIRVPADIAFASLVERGRLLLDPQPGPQLVGALRELAQVGRNAAAHGRETALDRDQVAGWMVDVAATYEWVQLAQAVV